MKGVKTSYIAVEMDKLVYSICSHSYGGHSVGWKIKFDNCVSPFFPDSSRQCDEQGAAVQHSSCLLTHFDALTPLCTE